MSVTPEQADQLDNDIETCNEEVEFRQVSAADALTTENLSRLYELELETLECLQQIGYATTTRPSRQSFIDAYQRQENVWTAYSVLPEIEYDEFLELEQKCPQAATIFGDELWNEFYSQ